MYNDNDTITVSVILITYNQVGFVAEALESILSQITSFNYEVLIGDDCSNDGTQIILDEYKEKYQDKIKLFKNEENIGATRNLYQLLIKSCGKYQAILEGDDYWISTEKLQTLVDFLENNRSYIGVSHRRERRNLEGTLIGYDPETLILNKSFTIEDFLYGKRFSIMGTVFRNIFYNSQDKYKDVFTASKNVADFTLCMILLDLGNVFITEKCFGVYRVINCQGQSNYNSITGTVEKYLDHDLILKAVDKFFEGKYSLRNERAQRQYSILRYSLKIKKRNEIKQVMKTIIFKDFIYLWFIFFPKYLLKRLLMN